MEKPWRIGEDGDVYEVHPVLPTFVPGDWAAVEQWLGVPLPSDYKELIGDGPALKFGDEFLIASPFSQCQPSRLPDCVRVFVPRLLADYLAGLASGRIEAAALGGWPGPNPQLRPVAE